MMPSYRSTVRGRRLARATVNEPAIEELRQHLRRLTDVQASRNGSECCVSPGGALACSGAAGDA